MTPEGGVGYSKYSRSCRRGTRPGLRATLHVGAGLGQGEPVRGGGFLSAKAPQPIGETKIHAGEEPGPVAAAIDRIGIGSPEVIARRADADGERGRGDEPTERGYGARSDSRRGKTYDQRWSNLSGACGS